MSGHKIGWLNRPGTKGETWNPIVGCSQVSPGCANCYAETMAQRLAAMALKGSAKTGQYAEVVHVNPIAEVTGGWNGKTIKAGGDALFKPLGWRKPRTVFVCSMSDLFHEATEEWMIDEVFGVMLACALFDNFDHTFIVLTKRAERMREYLSADPVELMMRWASYGRWIVTDDENYNLEQFLSADPEHYAKELMPLPNVWIGVTAENQEYADKRIPHLLETPAEVRFVSIEPMLERIKLSEYWLPAVPKYDGHGRMDYRPNLFYDTLDWVICGCESGPARRPMYLEWANRIREQCKDARVPFFMKQMVDPATSEFGFGAVVKDIDRFPEELKVREFPKGGAE